MSAAPGTSVIELHTLQTILRERSHRKAVQRAVEAIAQLVPSCSVSLLRIGPQGVLRFEAWANILSSVVRGAERSFSREGLPRNLLDVVRTKKSVVIEDLSSYADWREPVSSTASWAGFPILLQGRVIAIVNVQTLRQRITPAMIDVIEPVARTIALLILRYEEAHELAAHSRQQKILYEMAMLGMRQQEMGEMLGQVLQLIGRILRNPYVDILLYDARREVLVLTANRGHQVQRIGTELDTRSSKGVTVRAFQTRKPVIIRDTKTSKEFVEGLWPARSELAIPLVVQGGCVGVLNLESLKVGAFAQSDIRLLSPFTSGLSLLIDNQQKAKQLNEQATRDGLTGFFNHRMMDEMVPRELQRAARYHHDVSLAMLDLDNFKAVNDHLGHKEGDRLLRVFAACIRKVVRASDLMYRYGGDEFLILFPETTIQQAEELLSRLDTVLCPGFATALGPVTFSAGIASYVSDPSAEDLVKLADDRLYQSKRLGRGHITSQ
ncbi:MAG: sensor domain-containing diguanylate cyclase [Candidatus Cryosericum sp.]